MMFTAWAYGYLYEWEIVSDVILDAQGRPFVRAKPVRRIKGKQGRISRPAVWHLSLLPDTVHIVPNAAHDGRQGVKP